MPFSAFIPLIGAGLQTGANLFTNSANMRNQDRINRQNMDFQREQYHTQRQDMLTDRAFENEYNSPAAQMNRLKAAGLNPNLVYGNGATQLPSAKSQGSDFGSGNSKAYEQNIELGSIMDAALLSAQIRKLEADTALTNEQAKTQQSIRDDYDSRGTLRNIQYDETYNRVNIQRILLSKDLQVKQKEAELEKTLAGTKATLSDAQQRVLQTSSNIKEAIERISLMQINKARTSADIERIKATTARLLQDKAILEPDRLAAELGISKNSPFFMKLFANFISPLLEE